MQAAVPKYVTDHGFADCSTGHRFNLYFPVWNSDWGLSKDGANTTAVRTVATAHAASLELTQRLRLRQLQLAEALAPDRRCIIEAETMSPFATGLGLEHPIENGFAFLSPYGVAYLAGSGVKGVLRRAAEELHEADPADITDGVIAALFGADLEKITLASRGALSCWDVFPQCDAMTVEIMTPHYGEYYLGKETPHDAGRPNPIAFLAVPAGAKMRFVLTYEPDLVPEAERAALVEWQALVVRIAAHAFDWLGFGAKTAVGYGAMRFDAQARAAEAARQLDASKVRDAALAEATRQRRFEQASPAERAILEFLDQRGDKNQPKLNALIDGLAKGRFGEHSVEVARAVKQLMQAEGRWKMASTKKNPDKDRDFQDTLKVRKHVGEQ